MIYESRDTTQLGNDRRAAFTRQLSARVDAQRYLGFFAGLAIGIILGALLPLVLL